MNEIEYRFSRKFSFGKLPTFYDGILSAFSIFVVNRPYTFHENDEEADFEALKNDWEAVGCDLKFSLEAWKRDESKKLA